MLEVERKFLVLSDAFKSQTFEKKEIKQGYLSKDPERSVRIRIKGGKGFLTIKGKSNESGITRFEWEKEIPTEEAEELLKLCLPEIIRKTRYLVKIDGFVFEIDEFSGKNSGLLLAEIELGSENQDFPKPEWLGQEVTGQKEYYNAYLSEHPFSRWKK